MKAYRFTRWKEEKEVTLKGKIAAVDTPPEELRYSELAYVRHPIFGHNLPPEWIKMTQKAYAKGAGFELMVYGFYWLLHNLSAAQTRQYRGWILDHRQRPLDAEGIKKQFLLNDLDVVVQCLKLLTDPEFDLIEYVEFKPEILPKSPTSPTIPESPPLFPNEGGAPPPESGMKGDAFLIENETKTKGNLKNVTKGVPDKSGNTCPDSIFKFFTDFGPDFDSANPLQLHLKMGVFLPGLIPPHGEMDRNTIRKLLRMVHERVMAGRADKEIYRKIAEAARAATGPQIKNPIAKFISLMRDLGFRLKAREGVQI